MFQLKDSLNLILYKEVGGKIRLGNASQSTIILEVEIATEFPTGNGRLMLTDDIGFIYESEVGLPSGYEIGYYKLNEEGCHKNCKGCYEPGRIDRCMTCKEGLTMNEGVCGTECPLPGFMNYLGECQMLSAHYDFQHAFCSRAGVAPNFCLECSPNSEMISGICECRSGYTEMTNANTGYRESCSIDPCPIAGCEQCENATECIKCASGNVWDGTTCSVNCPEGSYRY